MIRRPPRSTQSRSSAASDVYKRQRLLEVTDHRLLDLARVDRTEGDLNCVIAIFICIADLRHDAWSGLDHRHGNKAVLGVPDLGHPQLLAEYALDRALNSVSHGG